MDKLPSLALQRWLEDAGSFIKRLRQRQLNPRVVVLDQKWAYPTPRERACLHLPLRRSVFVREVEIRDEKGPFMFARTVLPPRTLSGRGRCLAQLGTRSLGSVLFANPKFERSAFEIRPCQLLQYSSQTVWERQSFFYLKGKALLLREVFLPRLIDFINAL